MMAWWERAKVGDKVVCVCDYSKLHRIFPITMPVIGQVYTIRTIEVISSQVAIRFFEIVNPEYDYKDEYSECRFLAKRFRPVKSTETGMEMLRGLLNGAPAHRAAPDSKPSAERVREKLTGLARQ